MPKRKVTTSKPGWAPPPPWKVAPPPPKPPLTILDRLARIHQWTNYSLERRYSSYVETQKGDLGQFLKWGVLDFASEANYHILQTPSELLVTIEGAILLILPLPTWYVTNYKEVYACVDGAVEHHQPTDSDGVPPGHG